ncbi:hypothetical protein UPYG_G00144470 [Umbra pygmaea]|uniref:Uncharacterized protein n=1 Tax=Umbra pygmaea TaxID=75934 RepID=A0ABD0WW82_UMBPY
MITRVGILDAIGSLSSTNVDNRPVPGLPGYAPMYRASGAVTLVSADECQHQQRLDLRNCEYQVLAEVARLQLFKNIRQPALMEKMEGRLQTQDQCFLGAKVWKRRKNIIKDVLDPATGLLVRCMQYQSVTLSPYKI